MSNKINQTAKNVIDLQIKALKKLKNSIDASFIKAVKTINRCESKVIVCGVGKVCSKTITFMGNFCKISIATWYCQYLL